MTVNYPAFPMIALSLPGIIKVKVTQFVDCAIAIDRLTAIQWPIAYQTSNRVRYITLVVLVGIVYSASTIVFIFVTTDLKVS